MTLLFILLIIALGLLIIFCAGASKERPDIFGGGGSVDGHAEPSQAQAGASVAHRTWVAGIKPGPPLPTNFGNKPKEGRVAMELQDRIENHQL